MGADARLGPGELRRSASEAGRLILRAASLNVLWYALATLAGAAAPVAVAWLTKLVLDRLTRPGTAGEITGLVVALAAVGVVVAVVPRLSGYLAAQLGRSIGVRALDRLFQATEKFIGLGPFENPVFLDRLRLAQQGTATAGRLVDGVFGLGRGTVTLVGFVGSLLVISPVMTVVVLAAAVPALAAELTLSRRQAAVLWEIGPAQRRELFYATLLGSVAAAKEIRLFGLGGFLRGRMLAERGTADTAQRRVDRRGLAVGGTLALLGAIVAGGGLVWAVRAASRGGLSVGDVSMFIAAVAGVQSALNTLVQSITGVHRQLLVFSHYAIVVGMPPDLATPAQPAPAPVLRCGIELRDVWFRYSDGHPWVLRGVNLFIPYGRSVGLVGDNGAGKSTIVKLLCRLYDPTRGAILWDGVDLRRISPDRLRERISAVFQDYMHYDFSAADNIAVGDLTALRDAERIRESASGAGVHEVLAALPHGYDTLLTRTFFRESAKGDPQTGVVLSGGQWQRVALARAFLRSQPDLMILDEPSSGLDPKAEHDIHTRMRRYRDGGTSLLISHRLNAVRAADHIVVLDGGAVIEQGVHETLVAADGAYATMFRLQAAGYGDEPLPAYDRRNGPC